MVRFLKLRIQIKFYSSYIGIRNVMPYENICVARIILNVQGEQEAMSVNTRGVIGGLQVQIPRKAVSFLRYNCYIKTKKGESPQKAKHAYLGFIEAVHQW